MTTKIGNTDVVVGAPTVVGYIVQSVTDPAGSDIDSEDIIDHSTGQLVTRLVHQVFDKITATLTTTTGTPNTEFPRGKICTLGLFNGYYVDDCQVENTRSGQRVTVSLTDIGIT